MLRNMLAGGALLLSGVFAVPADAASIEVRNRSVWEIHYLHIGPAGDPDWGPDQLGGDRIIDSGETFTLTGVSCGRYDVQVIDEEGDACALYDVALCDDKYWEITDELLVACVAEGG